MSDSFSRRSTTLGKLSAALGLATGAAFDQYGEAPRINKGKHRVAAESKAGRQYVSPQYQGASSKFVAQRNSGGGAREVARRARRIAGRAKGA